MFAPDPATFPTVRDNLFDPPRLLIGRAQETPIRPLLFADGHEGWLVTGFAAVREVLADPHFSAAPEATHPVLPGSLTSRNRETRPGFFVRMDPPDHTRMRRLLTGQFTMRRMKLLQPRIEEITTACLDAMEAQGPPSDLVRDFALPVPSLVICELLGVPYGDREHFQHKSRVLLDLRSSAHEAEAAVADLLGYLYGLIAAKRADPADDLTSGLLRGGDLTDEELAGVSLLLLIAGHETTANMIALGAFALLRHPGQLAKVREDPSYTESAVEELLRYLSIVHLGPTRTATQA